MRRETTPEKHERFRKRNEAVRKYFEDVQHKNPKWAIEFVIEEVADKFFLATRTVSAIVSNEGIYGGIDILD